ncbi:hypothetical protein ABIA33_005949 [Streptacidiphilus sp. MAP12-16]|jgi:hypothetical protein|uniref:hypothetical protein n=1 Tax=Streptacidiphilus sp. MAP12-16 TaxID=3156300 RepID=UPI003519BB0A
MADVLLRVTQRRVVLADRAERLRRELAEIDDAVARLESAEVVSGQATTPPSGCRGPVAAKMSSTPLPGGPRRSAPRPGTDN